MNISTYLSVMGSTRGFTPVTRKELAKYKPVKIRVLFLGNGSVGKTSLIRRLVGEDFDSDYTPTVYDVFKFREQRDRRHFLFEVTDFSGVYSFPAMRRITVRTNDIFVLVYDIKDKASLHEVSKLKQELKQLKGENCGDIPVIVVGNKSDFIESNLNEFVHSQAQQTNECIVTSAKTGYNVPRLLDALVLESEKLVPRKRRSRFSFRSYSE